MGARRCQHVRAMYSRKGFTTIALLGLFFLVLLPVVAAVTVVCGPLEPTAVVADGHDYSALAKPELASILVVVSVRPDYCSLSERGFARLRADGCLVRFHPCAVACRIK